MSDEELYDNDPEVKEEIETAGASELGSDDYEVVISRRAPKGDVFMQVFPRTMHWIIAGVRPEQRLHEDPDEMTCSFVKKIKDPLFPSEEGARYIRFNCNIVLSELEIDLAFTHIELFYQDNDGSMSQAFPLTEGAEECAEIKKVFEKVTDNLTDYLSK